jgi:hypothetical protein
MKITAILIAIIFAVPASFAQVPRVGVAQLKGVHGNVLVSREAGLGAGAEGMRLLRGVRVITTAKSDVTVLFDDGCEVKLKENERFEVETGKPCAALAALPQSILATPAGASVAAASGASAAALALMPALGGAAIGGAAISLGAFRGRRVTQSVSPS